MIIKAGTYRWNDVVDTSNAFSQSLAYSFTYNDVVKVANNLSCAAGALMYNGTFEEGRFTLYQNGSWNADGGQIINVLEDTDVDDTFGTLFISNTTMLIKAGTYRWNDVLPYQRIEYIDIPFIVSAYNPDTQTNETLTFDAMNFDNVSTTDTPHYRLDYLYYGGTTLQNQLFAYGNVNHWNELYEFYKGVFEVAGEALPEWIELVKGLGQIITITEDTYVPTTFGLWANENWKEYVEETTTPAVEITYKDKVITLKAGQTARLHNADGSAFGFEEDLVIKANEVEKVEMPTIIEAPSEITANGTYNASDFGADGISKVTVNVPTYITVATVDDLPTDSADGTIAIVEG